MSINQRLKSLIDVKENGKQSAFAQKVGVSPTVVGTFMPPKREGDRVSKPGFEVLSKIIEAYPELRIEWLMTGNGSMLKNQPEHPQKNQSMRTEKDDLDYEVIDYTSGSVKRLEEQDIPLYDFEAAAGLVQLFNSRQNILDYIHIPNMPRCDGAIHIAGDSMYPLLKSGDIVMYKVIPDIKTGIVFGNMYLLSAIIGGEEHTLVKYLQRSDLGSDYVKLGSQNQHHEAIDILISNIKALAFVKASIRINSMS